MAMKKAQTSMFEVGTPNDILALVPAHPVMAGPFTIFLHNIFRLSDFYKYKIRTRSEKQNLRFSSSNSKLHSFAFYYVLFQYLRNIRISISSIYSSCWNLILVNKNVVTIVCTGTEPHTYNNWQKKTKFYISYDNSLYLISNTTDIMFYPTFPPPNVSDPARLLPFIFQNLSLILYTLMPFLFVFKSLLIHAA